MAHGAQAGGLGADVRHNLNCSMIKKYNRQVSFREG